MFVYQSHLLWDLNAQSSSSSYHYDDVLLVTWHVNCLRKASCCHVPYSSPSFPNPFQQLPVASLWGRVVAFSKIFFPVLFLHPYLASSWFSSDGWYLISSVCMCVCVWVSHPNNTAAKQEETTIMKPKLRQISILSLQKTRKRGGGGARFIGVLPSSTKISISRKQKRITKTKRSFTSTSSILTDHVHLAVLFGFVDDFLNYFCWDCEIVVPENRNLSHDRRKMNRFRCFDAHDRVATQNGRPFKSEGGTHRQAHSEPAATSAP